MSVSTNKDGVIKELGDTKAGNYFISNYPPFAYWSPEHNPGVLDALGHEISNEAPLGLYLHTPFCRKRCHFCYFKVYTDKNSDEVKNYLSAVTREIKRYRQQAAIQGRKPKFIYFGGGTPSYLSTEQLTYLTEELRSDISWEEVEELTFECEPGTLTLKKLEILKNLGVTRLSLGIENFKDEILETNGRAHRSAEIGRAWEHVRSLNFPQTNIDLISGMIGESDDNWKRCIDKTIEMQPDSVTIYQMELPHNTKITKEMKQNDHEAPVADWPTKRRWVSEAFARFEENGYRIASAYTVVKKDKPVKFLYRDHLWHGADLLSLGVASFSHVQGMHFQNEAKIENYLARIDAGELPIARSYQTTPEERLIREFVLQLKLGKLELEPFTQKFGTRPDEKFKAALDVMKQQELLDYSSSQIQLTRKGLLEIDQHLPNFFLDQHRGDRYT